MRPANDEQKGGCTKEADFHVYNMRYDEEDKLSFTVTSFLPER